MASRPLPDNVYQMRSSCTGNRDPSDGSRLAVDVERWHFVTLRAPAPYANDFPSPTRPLCVNTHLRRRLSIKTPIHQIQRLLRSLVAHRGDYEPMRPHPLQMRGTHQSRDTFAADADTVVIGELRMDHR